MWGSCYVGNYMRRLDPGFNWGADSWATTSSVTPAAAADIRAAELGASRSIHSATLVTTWLRLQMECTFFTPHCTPRWSVLSITPLGFACCWEGLPFALARLGSLVPWTSISGDQTLHEA